MFEGMNNFYKGLFKIVKPYLGERILNLGCEKGHLDIHLIDKKRVLGLDIEQASVDIYNERYKDYEHMRAIIMDAQSDELLKFKGKFDTVLSINALEHIPDDLKVLKNLDKMGVNTVVIIVPATRWVYNTVDVGVGHIRRYDKRLWKNMVMQTGFKIKKMKYLKFSELSAQIWYGKILKVDVMQKGVAHLYDKLIPFIWGVESLLPLPCGNSILVVLKK